jgi:hypothetical protein
LFSDDPNEDRVRGRSDVEEKRLEQLAAPNRERGNLGSGAGSKRWISSIAPFQVNEPITAL